MIEDEKLIIKNEFKKMIAKFYKLGKKPKVLRYKWKYCGRMN